jgi:hypothetical protein
MITPILRHSFFLQTPLLVLVRRDARKLTLRTFREWFGEIRPEPLAQSEVARLLAEHAATAPDALFPGRPIEGDRLDDRLSGRKFCEMGGICLDLDGDLGKREWSDHGQWLFPVDYAGRPLAPFNRFLETMETKARAMRLLAFEGRNCAMQIFVPFASCDFEACSFTLALHRDFGLVGNLDPGEEITDQAAARAAPAAFPAIRFSDEALELAPDGYGIVTTQLIDPDGNPITDTDTEIFFETTGGYLPKQRLMTQGGEAELRIGTLGLAPGDTFRVKAGFRHFTGVCELTVQVT